MLQRPLPASRLDVALTEDHLQISSRPGEGRPIQFHVQDETIQLVPGARHEFSLEQRHDRAMRVREA